ncbi:ATP-dependent DNA helicase RecQ [Peribacillus deserti]|uniref:DNA helicase RecQ n=1 Tax=Peribacillus deserti TaxID=673318 RepID=A0ABS2QF60_9BACI|nr:DNA helicase RecQ [Peribacillus deserti]MBM7691163.1 ATP-dependent DNA helicase RecQ [Peribacillus deserti]
MLDQAKNILKNYFGYSQFRAGQEQIIENILTGNDTVGIMPTGGGKSITYQVPALVLEGITLVISPLISLMKDQVDALEQAGISAAYINSSLSSSEISERMDEAASGDIKLLYLAPERLESQLFLNELLTLPVSLVAIDEAHCISQWGHDFRPSYLRIQTLFHKFKKKPVVLALTATATPQVREDICQTLNIPEQYTVITGFERSNLSFTLIKGQDRDKYLMNYLKQNESEAGIIYAATRKNVEQLFEKLQKAGITAGKYHAGMSNDERNREQEKFLNDEISVMVATNAFGMGIDKSNVRYTIHYQVPKNMESYYQEAGRAGRDGLPSECILVFSEQDVQLQRYLIDQSESISHKQNELEKLQFMREYCYTEKCLQGFIMNYFGDRDIKPCGRCSNCLDERVSVDVTRDAQMVLSCIIRMNERFGKTMVAQVLTGSSNKKVSEFGFNKLTTFGLLKDRSVKEVSEFIDYLTSEQFIGVTGGQFPLLFVTDKGKSVLKGNSKVNRKETIQVIEVVKADGLFEKLRSLRKEIAAAEGVPPFVIFSDLTLRDMCAKLPVTLDNMGEVKGVGAQKLEKYGKPFSEKIQEYLQEHPEHEPIVEIVQAPPKKKKNAGTENSYLESYDKFMAGETIKDISIERDLSVNTIENHIIRSVEEGKSLNWEEIWTKDQENEIEEAVLKTGTDFLKPIKDLLPPEISYFMIKLWLVKNKAGQTL